MTGTATVFADNAWRLVRLGPWRTFQDLRSYTAHGGRADIRTRLMPHTA